MNKVNYYHYVGYLIILSFFNLIIAYYLFRHGE